MFTLSTKSVICSLSKIKNANIPVDLEPKLFDSLVTLYASDVWGYGKKAGLEKYIYNLLEKTL
jgi:hypothetical protein